MQEIEIDFLIIVILSNKTRNEGGGGKKMIGRNKMVGQLAKKINSEMAFHPKSNYKWVTTSGRYRAPMQMVV